MMENMKIDNELLNYKIHRELIDQNNDLQILKNNLLLLKISLNLSKYSKENHKLLSLKKRIKY